MEIETGEAMSALQARIVACTRCPRLVAWREAAALNPPLRHRGQEYWARPVPSLGSADAELVLVGLAPGMHGSNRTGRMFTGDKSGEWLFRALYRAGFANQPESNHRDDDLRLNAAFITATCRCAPPGNKPLPEEIGNCREYLLEELHLLPRMKVMLGLGKIGFDAAFDAARAVGYTNTRVRPKFGHGAEFALNPRLWLLGSYHPSQQNTFTGKLTEPMFDAVFARAAQILAGDD